MATTREIQKRLQVLGFDPGPIDGIPGPRTTRAIRMFQAARGLVVDGIVGPNTTAALWPSDKALPLPKTRDVLPPWYEEAKRHMGLKEVAGSGTNATIAGWLAFLKAGWRDDETPWCGTFVGYCMAKTVPDEPLPANPFGARQWLKYGQPIKDAAIGGILVFSRPGSSWAGHVGFYAGERGDAFRVLGGNQSNMVNETWIAKSRLLGIRWPKTYPLPQTGAVVLTGGGKTSANEA